MQADAALLLGFWFVRVAACASGSKPALKACPRLRSYLGLARVGVQSATFWRGLALAARKAPLVR